MYCLTCAEHTVHALPATLRQFPSQSPILRYFQSPRLPGEWWMSKGNKNERKKMDGLGQKMEESMMDHTLFRVSSVRGLSLAL